MVRRSLRRSRGFTVVELIVALSISAMTLLSGYELFQVLKEAGNAQSADLAATADLVRGLDLIREDLLHAVPRAGSRTPIFVGANRDPDEDETTTQLLEFYSLCAGGGDDGFRSLRRLSRVRYELARNEDLLVLSRRVTPVVGPGPTSGATARARILDHLAEVEIAFHNGHDSVPSFSSNERLPVCVALTVTAHGRMWSLSVKLPCGLAEEQP